MKKNLITVLILALCIINLAFNILLVFTFLPSVKKTNKLVGDIMAVLDLEIASQNQGGNGFDVSNLAPFQLEQSNPINLAAFAYFLSAIKYSYLGNDTNFVGIVLLYFIT